MFAWNRVEALVTLSLDHYLRARTALSQNHIRLQSKRVSVEKEARRADGEMLRRPVVEYYIYVHKEDLTRAQELIRAIGPEQGEQPGLTW